MWGFKYKSGNRIQEGDKVLVSKKVADEHAGGNRNGTVVGLRGFVTVALANGDRIDLDMRSIKEKL